VIGQKKSAINVDRLYNRLWNYPRALRKAAGGFGLFHIADHSHSHLVHELPAERTGVFCHDLDTFRCLLEPQVEPRPRWFRAMAGRILRGMQKAAVVFYTTDGIRRQIEQHGLIDPGRLVWAPLGICAEFSPNEPAAAAGDLPRLPVAAKNPYVLHVGVSIPRKRIDVLLDVFAGLRSSRPDLRLVQVGGEWTEAQRRQITRLGIEPAIEQVRGLSREQLAALYRGAAVVVQPSDAEGFGLPIIEALACGAPVVVSDLPILREVGGDAVLYCPVAAVGQWVETVGTVLDNPAAAPAIAMRLEWASRYSWPRHAQTICQAYTRLM
jgi:glycosyltransferase involved in cell wall biosynthesis